MGGGDRRPGHGCEHRVGDDRRSQTRSPAWASGPASVPMDIPTSGGSWARGSRREAIGSRKFKGLSRGVRDPHRNA